MAIVIPKFQIQESWMKQLSIGSREFIESQFGTLLESLQSGSGLFEGFNLKFRV